MIRALGPIRWMACVAFLALAGGRADAGQFTLDITGQAITGSSFGIAPFATDLSGQSFDLKAVFEGTPLNIGIPGAAGFKVDSLVATVGSSTFTITSVLELAIADQSNTLNPGDYEIQLASNQPYFGFKGASQTITVGSLASTVFQNFVDLGGGSTYTLSDAHSGSNTSGTLTIKFDPSVGVNASISAAPEPASVLTALVGLAGVGLLRRRRRV